ncbi:MAG: flagellar export chaperone FliS [Syntrophales bacterium]|nr:flagellar export chaperone FliS [Syntrophales bacterium]
MYREAFKSYEKAKQTTTDPLRLVVMCYSAAIENLKEAKVAYEAGNYIKKAQALQKTLDIIYLLDSALDMKSGGHIAANLRSLYHFIIKTLVNADLKKDIAMIERVISILSDLESAWIAIENNKSTAKEAHPSSEELKIDSKALQSTLLHAWSA